MKDGQDMIALVVKYLNEVKSLPVTADYVLNNPSIPGMQIVHWYREAKTYYEAKNVNSWDAPTDDDWFRW